MRCVCLVLGTIEQDEVSKHGAGHTTRRSLHIVFTYYFYKATKQSGFTRVILRGRCSLRFIDTAVIPPLNPKCHTLDICLSGSHHLRRLATIHTTTPAFYERRSLRYSSLLRNIQRLRVVHNIFAFLIRKQYLYPNHKPHSINSTKLLDVTLPLVGS
jgi:hypothetical protein